MTEKKKGKYDRWFIIVLGLLVWTLGTHLVEISGAVAADLGNWVLWLRLLVCSGAIVGNFWVMRLYITSTKRQAQRIAELDEILKDQPEIKARIIEILKGQV